MRMQSASTRIYSTSTPLSIHGLLIHAFKLPFNPSLLNPKPLTSKLWTPKISRHYTLETLKPYSLETLEPCSLETLNPSPLCQSTAMTLQWHWENERERLEQVSLPPPH